MKTNSFLCTVLLCSTALFSFSVQAKPGPTGETYTASAKTFQQACRGKSAGSPVSLALNGVIFNGSCQVILVPNNASAARTVEDSLLTQACTGKPNQSVTATLNGQEVKGKCVLSFHSIEPATAP